MSPQRENDCPTGEPEKLNLSFMIAGNLTTKYWGRGVSGQTQHKKTQSWNTLKIMS